MIDKVRLTQLVQSAGCAAKIFPDILKAALKDIDFYQDDKVIIGFDGSDDAGVYKLSDELSLIHTTDFFTPVADDPYVFGKIAAANSLSDVYSMGGKPLNALNIIAFPQNEDIKILKEILSGGNDKAREAQCSIIGGHSVDIKNILYGLAVTGIINNKNIKPNSNAKEGDFLVLTKGIGTGVLNNAVKYGEPPDAYIKELLQSMERLNKNASEIMIKYNANSCTDITGFGLAGHSMQMAKASGKVFHFNMKNIPLLDGALWAVRQNFLTRGDKSNRFYTEEYNVSLGDINFELEHLLFDPQTSGGLLISIEQSNAKSLIEELCGQGDEKSCIVGWVENSGQELKPGTLVYHY